MAPSSRWTPRPGPRSGGSSFLTTTRPPSAAWRTGRAAAGRSRFRRRSSSARRQDCSTRSRLPTARPTNGLAGTGEGPGGSNGGAGPAGDTRAWDARTGKVVWTFHTVPRPGEFGYDTWGADSAKNRSGVNVWGYTSLDAERGILYMPLGAPNNDRVGIDRPGNNLFSSSVVAVDANTGRYLWHFQVVHHDIWDYDTQSAPLLVDLRRDGQIVPAILIVNKTGLLFTLNRVTGKPIFDIEERPVPKSDVPGEQASPTQPFPVKPEPLAQT